MYDELLEVAEGRNVTVMLSKHGKIKLVCNETDEVILTTKYISIAMSFLCGATV